jgi:DNA invertase Pin-like site-specific DNA recombinase
MMSDLPWRHKIKPQHLARKAVVYLRQSTEKQVRENVASQRLQYGLEHRARELGWSEVEILDQDLGSSASVGASPRHDFDALVGSVALREVGIIMSREVSRLSRTDKDWCHLLEVCRVFDTLLGDAEQVYDLSQMDDQLVLGIKGTMSVVELNVLRQRLQQGAEEKARRGELVRLLPPGYRHDGSGQVVKDPDQRVQQAIALVFAKFRQTWSIRQTFIWFDDEGIRLPVNKSVGGRMRIVWQPPTHAFIDDVLHNPFYAGAYVYGRRPVETVLKEGRGQAARQVPAPTGQSCLHPRSPRGLYCLADLRGEPPEDAQQCPRLGGGRGGRVGPLRPGVTGERSALRALRPTPPRSLLGQERDGCTLPVQGRV